MKRREDEEDEVFMIPNIFEELWRRNVGKMGLVRIRIRRTVCAFVHFCEVEIAEN